MNSPRHQQAHKDIRQNADKQLAERYDPTKKLSGPAPVLETFNPPIITSQPIAPDPKLKGRIQHGTPRGK